MIGPAPETVLNCMPPGQVINVIDIARSLGVSERTVFRRVRDLRQAGHRIDGSRGIGLMRRAPKAAR